MKKLNLVMLAFLISGTSFAAEKMIQEYKIPKKYLLGDVAELNNYIARAKGEAITNGKQPVFRSCYKIKNGRATKINPCQPQYDSTLKFRFLGIGDKKQKENAGEIREKNRKKSEDFLRNTLKLPLEYATQESKKEAEKAIKATNEVLEDAQDLAKTVGSLASEVDAYEKEKEGIKKELEEVAKEIDGLGRSRPSFFRKDGTFDFEAEAAYNEKEQSFRKKELERGDSLSSRSEKLKARLEKIEGKLSSKRDELAAKEKEFLKSSEKESAAIQDFHRNSKIEEIGLIGIQQREDGKIKPLTVDGVLKEQSVYEKINNDLLIIEGIFQDAQEGDRLAELALTDIDLMKQRNKLNQRSIKMFQDRINDHLSKTAMGKYFNSQIAKMAKEIACNTDREALCAAKDSNVIFKQIQDILGAPILQCTK